MAVLPFAAAPPGSPRNGGLGRRYSFGEASFKWWRGVTASPPIRASLKAGEQIGYGTLAQIAIGSGFARLLQRDLPGAAREVAPVLALPPERRLVTMAGKLTELAVACETAAISGAGAQAAELAGNIRDYCQQTAASALPGKESR
jgi:hypothetical protein